MRAILLTGELIRPQLFVCNPGADYAVPINGWLKERRNRLQRIRLLHYAAGEYGHTAIEKVSLDELRTIFSIKAWLATIRVR